MTIKDYKLPLIIIGVGILFSLYLQWLIPEGVFFSGDAGLKALLAKQLSQGQFRFDLVSPSLPWVRQLWQNDLYPFEEPFVYYINDRYYITFPYTFPLVTAPFQALFGYRGLYIIPLVSTWVIWLTCYWVCKRLELSQTIASVALVVLIFASPLTLYSAMYWEHTLALALAWLGLALFFFPRPNQLLSIRRVIISGILIGGSVWFRPEFLALVSLIIVFVYAVSLWNWARQQLRIERFNLSKLSYVTEHQEIFAISLIATVGLFFLSNKLIYNHPLGIHAIQVVEETGLSERLLGGWKNFQGLSLALFEFLPITFFALAYLLIGLGKNSHRRLTMPTMVLLGLSFGITAFVGLAVTQGRIYKLLWILVLAGLLFLAWLKTYDVRLNLEMLLIYGSGLLFLILVSLMVPEGTAGLIAGGKQWGARFLLLLVPIICLLATKQLEFMLNVSSGGLKYIGIVGFAALLLVSIHKNSYAGVKFLQKNHDGILPAIQVLQQQLNPVIAVSHQFVAQAIEPGLAGNKIFFKAETSQDLVQLGKTLVEEGQQKFTYVCYPFRKCQPPEEASAARRFSQDNQQFRIELSELGEFGKYPMYEGLILKESE